MINLDEPASERPASPEVRINDRQNNHFRFRAKVWYIHTL
jgi:hypothetical protein